MISYDEVGEMLDQIADSLPNELYRELNGGILLQPQSKLHPKAIDNDLYILGEYRHDNLGRYIVIFYGSFAAVYPNISKNDLYERLKKTLVHEIRHHNEFLAGYKDLILYDEDKIDEYLQHKKSK